MRRLLAVLFLLLAVCVGGGASAKADEGARVELAFFYGRGCPHCAAMAWLALYNLVFVAPMIGITAAAYFGFTTAEKAEEWRVRNLQRLHLIAGIIILALGVAMLAALWAGYA